MESIDISGRVAIVTGGTSGIGLGICKAFAKHGCKVALTGRSEEKGNAAMAEISEAAGCSPDDLLFVAGDVSEEESAKAMVKSAVSKFGRLDFLVNNAGVTGSPKTMLDTSSEDFARIMQVNVFGTFYCMKHGIEQMKSQPALEKGCYSVVNISSIAGILPFPTQVAYSTSKHAVIGLTRSTAKEVAKHNISVNAICPGVIRTSMETAVSDEMMKKTLHMQVIGRMGECDEIARAAIFACTNPFMIGHTFVMDGGWSCY